MSMMRKRVIAIVAAALAIIILAVSLAGVMEYVDIIEFEDVDGTKYYARKDDGVYKLYAKGSKEPLQLDEKYNKYYITTGKGTLVLIDPETGKATDYIPVEDAERDDEVGFNNRVMIFSHVQKADILSLEVHNSTGTYTFERRNIQNEIARDGTFIIKGSPFTTFDQNLFAELYVGAGYTLTVDKIAPIKRDANGDICTHKEEDVCECVKDLAEYGLVSQVRERVVTDASGNPVIDEATGEPKTETYNYEPAYYILSSENEQGVKQKHKVIIGDMLVTGGGYYAQYVDISGDTEKVRDRAVYVLDTATGGSILSPIEDYVTPMLSYPMSMNRYFDVDDFVIYNRNVDEYVGGELDSDPYKSYDDMISFSYIDLAERENTMAAISPYEFKLGLEGYSASDTAINSCLYNFYSPTLTRTVKYAPDISDLVEYGFFVEQKDANGNVVKNEKGEIQYDIFPKYIVSYKYDVVGDDGKIKQKIYQTILISDRDYKETRNYYTYTIESIIAVDENGKATEEANDENTLPYNFIVEAEGHMFDFLRWDQYDWVNPSIVDQNISFVTDIKLTSPDYNATFKIYNPRVNEAEGTNSDRLYVEATDSSGASKKTFSVLEVVDRNQIRWTITPSDIKVFDLKKNADVKIKNEIAYYDYNDLGNQVLCRNGYIQTDTTLVEVTKNYVNVYKNVNGEKGSLIESYLRYDTSLFRKYYQTVLYTSLEGSYIVSDEEESAIVKDENLMLTFEISFKDAKSAGEKVTTDVYKFYKINDSSRKVYITVNGNGGFYVYKNKVQKLITDSQNFFANRDFEPDAKR